MEDNSDQVSGRNCILGESSSGNQDLNSVICAEMHHPNGAKVL